MATQPSVAAKSQTKSTFAGALLAWFLFLLLTVLAIVELKAPNPLPATAPQTEFSAERALTHVRAIARTPHPIGSSAEQLTRDYVVSQLSALGMNPQVFAAPGILNIGNFVAAGYTSDILGRLQGTANSKAVILMAHYDSVPSGPGAADDAAGVAAILETMRALRAGPALRNDLIVLITDGEEAGSLGADAFSASHPWMKDAGVIINFEARGNQGPSLLFETSANNAALIREVAAGAPYVTGSSLFYSLYKLLPNDTDVTAFRATNTPALNFAFGGHLEAYHSTLDTPDNLSLSSLQHHGSNALGLARQFGAMDLTELRKQQGDDIFFNWFGDRLVAYSERWVPIGDIIVSLILASIILLSWRRDTLDVRLFWGLLGALLIMLAIPLVMVIAEWLLLKCLKGRMIIGDASPNALLLIGLVLLGAAAATAIFVALRRQIKLQELSVAGLLLLSILNWASALLLPAGSYLLFWPLLFSSAGLLFLSTGRQSASPAKVWAGMAPAAVATNLLFAPIAYLLYVFLTLNVLSVAAIGLLLSLGFLVCIPAMDMAVPPTRWKSVTLLLLMGAGICLGIGSIRSHFSGVHPKRDSLVYAYNYDMQSAVWASYDDSLDSWTSQFIQSDTMKQQLLPAYFAGARRPTLSGPAPLIPLQPPVAIIKAQDRVGDLDILQLSVKSQRDVHRMVLRFDGSVKPVSLRVLGRDVAFNPTSTGLTLLLYGTNGRSVELELTLKSSGHLSLWLGDASPGLPGNRIRPTGLIGEQGSDETLTSREYVLGKKSK